jgi:serine/threonine protein kinase HipA of HipAB toxin-antitoxin module
VGEWVVVALWFVSGCEWLRRAEARRFYDETRMIITRTRLWVLGAGEHIGSGRQLACLLLRKDLLFLGAPMNNEREQLLADRYHRP